MTFVKRMLLPVVLIAMVVSVTDQHAQEPSVALHVIGDIDGPGADGATTVIKDATRVGNAIHAVGGAVTRTGCPNGLVAPCQNTDTAILWRSDGSPIQTLPDVASPPQNPSITATAITPDGRYIASAARDLVGPSSSIIRAVRVDAGSLTNLNLSAFVPQTTVSAGAVAISSEPSAEAGRILYARASGRGVRYDTVTQTSTVIPLVCPPGPVTPQCPAADTSNPVAERGSSADGSVAVGTSLFFSPATGNLRAKAYRYLHGSGVTTIPLLAGGPFQQNVAVAVSPDGNLVLLTGDSAAYRNGEAYLYDFTKPPASAITPLGSPNGSLAAPWVAGGRLCANQVCLPATRNVGGMTADGSVVVMNFFGLPGVEGQNAYFRNAHGWFNLTSVLAANGTDIAADGWEDLFIQGISPDGTLVYGAGKHFDPVTGTETVDGFVADFKNASIALKDYNPQPVPVADTSIVGAWTDDLNNPGLILLFTAEGVYYHAEDILKRGTNPPNPPAGTRLGTGFERGLYTFNGSGLRFTTLVDTNGDIGTSGGDFFTFPASVNGDVMTLDDGSGNPSGFLYRIVGSSGSFAGAWIAGDPTQRDQSFVGVALANGQIFQMNDHAEFGGSDDADRGTYTFTPTVCPALLPAGLACYQLDLFSLDYGPDLGNVVGIAVDGLRTTVLDDDGETIIPFVRVIDPARIPMIAGASLSASGVGGAAVQPRDRGNERAVVHGDGPAWRPRDQFRHRGD